MPEQHRFYINIGDWSGDGHEKCDRLLHKSNYSVKKLQQAYHKSCSKIGVKLLEVCSDYGEQHLEQDVAEKLLEAGCPMELLKEFEDDEDYIMTAEKLAELLVWFVGVSMPEDFECTLIKEENALNFNGFWGDLNESFGYGLYE
jgi:hypothetical protein